MSKFRTGILLLVLTIAVSLLAAGCGRPPGVTLDGAQTAQNHTLSVAGTGKVVTEPDIARLSVGVKTSDTDAQTAQDQNDEKMAQVIEAVKGAGVEDKDIQTTRYAVSPRYNYSKEDPEIVGYEVTHMVTVTIRAIDTVGQVLKAANQAGANQSYDISFDIEDRDTAYQQALSKAIENAKQKAQVMAQAAGVALKEPAAINEGGTPAVYQTRAYAETADYSAASVPVQSGTLDVTANVTIVYNIE
jgi:uncharacterized protein YggE